MGAVKVWGLPVPQGSMKCVGRGQRHQLVPTNAKKLKAWRASVQAAGAALLASLDGHPYAGPVQVGITFTVPRPPSVRRPWPSTKSAGDLDKLTRAALDALTASHLIGDDSQVVELTAVKAYPDTLGAADRLDQPGALIRIDTLDQEALL